MKVLFWLALMGLILSSGFTASLPVDLTKGQLSFSGPEMHLSGGRCGVEILVGREEKPLRWMPEGPAIVESEAIGVTPPFLGRKTYEQTWKWQHPDGYQLTWTLRKIEGTPGFTLQAAFSNHSAQPVRLQRFILLQTPTAGLHCDREASAWWLLSDRYTRRIFPLSQVLKGDQAIRASEYRKGKSHIMLGYAYPDSDPRSRDGHWRNFEELVTLYRQDTLQGMAIGAVGPCVSGIDFNFYVDGGNLLLEMIGNMDEILVDPGERRVSEEALFIAWPYRQAVQTINQWVAYSEGARTTKGPLYGWCSWYHYFWDVTAGDVRNAAQTVKAYRARIPLQTLQIDDGYQVARDSWVANEKFPQGMRTSAEEIEAAGALPGLWIAPLQAEHSHGDFPRDWYQRYPENRTLDPTNPAVQDYIRTLLKHYRQLGYRYFKFDYNEVGSYRPFNPKMTRFEIYRQLFRLYREAIGEDAYMLGCGAPRRPMVGAADSCRYGFDIWGRWRADEPLAADGLPSCPINVFDGIRTLVAAALTNGILYANDPDPSYSLPRVHTWDWDQELAGKPNGSLTWEELRTFHSYEGLLGGAMFFSEPLHQEKYTGKDSLRMMEIVNPPAPDHGYSLYGAVDPYGRRFGFSTQRPWGNFASVVLWNPGEVAADVSLNPEALEHLGKRFHVWSFWDENYLGVQDASYVARSIPKHGCRLVRLTDVPENPDQPVLVGSNLHVAMGSAEIAHIESTAERIAIHLTDAGARDGKLAIYSKKPLVMENATGCEAFVVPEPNNIYMAVLSNRKRLEPNRITLKIAASNAQSKTELLKDRQLSLKYKQASFDFE